MPSEMLETQANHEKLRAIATGLSQHLALVQLIQEMFVVQNFDSIDISIDCFRSNDD